MREGGFWWVEGGNVYPEKIAAGAPEMEVWKMTFHCQLGESLLSKPPLREA